MIPLIDENIDFDRGTLTARPTGFWAAGGNALMRSGASIAGSIDIAIGGLAGAAGDFENAIGNTSTRDKLYDLRDMEFEHYDTKIKQAKDYWTPDPGSVSMAGQVFSGLTSLVIPVMTGPAAIPLLVGDSAISKGADLVDKGVDTTTATLMGIGSGAMSAAQIAIPAAGKKLWQSFVLAAGNPVLGIGSRYAEKAALSATGYEKQAREIDPTDPAAVSTEVFLGLVFGGMAHYQKARATMPTAVEDAIDTAALHNKRLKDTPFEQTPKNNNAHLNALDKAADDMSAGKPVDVKEHVNEIMPTALPESFKLPEFQQGLKEHFKLSDDQTGAVTGLVEARARVEGLTTDEYISTRIADIVPGEAPASALYQHDGLKAQISNLFDYVVNKTSNALNKITLWELKDNEALQIKEKTGQDVSGYTRAIDNYSIAHILKEHGDPKIEEARGQLPITKDDIIRIPDVVSSPDNISDAGKTRQGRDGILYEKRINGYVYYVEEIRTGNKELVPTSMWKRATTPDAPPSQESPAQTSKTFSSPSDNSLPPAGEGVNALEQAAGGTKKGAVSFLADGRAVIHAFEQADFSTAVHELGHIFRRDLAGDDLAITEKWTGVDSGKWERAHEETFARGFEQYLNEGRPPTPEMQTVFDKFKQWITDIYRNVRGYGLSDVKMSPEIRGVFDRLFVDDPFRRSEPHPEAIEARRMADEAIKEAAQDIPEEITVQEDWGAGPAIDRKAEVKQQMIEATKRVKTQPAEPYDTAHLEHMRDRLAAAEGPSKTVDAETGAVTGRLKSGYPEWFQNAGYKQKEVLTILDKAIEGKPLTERQHGIVNDLLESSKLEFRKVEMLLKDDPLEREVMGIIAKEGDVPGGKVTGIDEAGNDTFSGMKQMLDESRAEVVKAREMKDYFERMANCARMGG